MNIIYIHNIVLYIYIQSWAASSSSIPSSSSSSSTVADVTVQHVLHQLHRNALLSSCLNSGKRAFNWAADREVSTRLKLGALSFRPADMALPLYLLYFSALEHPSKQCIDSNIFEAFLVLALTVLLLVLQQHN